MPEKFSSRKKGSKGEFPDMVTPLTEPLKPGDPRSPVNNSPMINPPDPLGYLSHLGGGKKKSK